MGLHAGPDRSAAAEERLDAGGGSRSRGPGPHPPDARRLYLPASRPHIVRGYFGGRHVRYVIDE